MTATETLAQYETLADKATKGPWLAVTSGEDSWDITGVAIDVADRDVDFLVACRAMGPAMAAALQEVLIQSDQPPGKFASDEQEQIAMGYNQALDLVRSIIGWHLEGK